VSLLDTIKAGISNKTTVLWPGSDVPIQVRVLSKAEIQEATFAAQRRFQSEKIEKDFTTIETLKDEETIQILWRAYSDGEGKPLTATVDVFRKTVNTDEVTALARAYQEFEQEVSPNFDAMDEETFKQFLEDLKKKPEETIGCVPSIALAKRLLRSLVVPPPS